MSERNYGRAGKYEYWHTGPSNWEVRRDGEVLSRHSSMGDASSAAGRRYMQDRAHQEGFKEGAAAGRNRRAVQTNPYDEGDMRHQGWAEGFHSKKGS